jgi:hypothetical protein
MDDSEWIRNEFAVIRDRFHPFLAVPKIRTVPAWVDRVIAWVASHGRA